MATTFAYRLVYIRLRLKDEMICYSTNHQAHSHNHLEMIRELILLSLGLVVIAEWDIEPKIVKKESKAHYCGPALTSVLNLVCDGLFKSPFKKYFKTPELGFVEENEKAYDEYFKYKSPFSSKAKALSVLQLRRMKRGPYDECCKKACSISELKGYCKNRR